MKLKRATSARSYAARLLPLLLCVAGLSLPASVRALQCAAVFPSALQNFHADGEIDFGKSSQVFGDPDNALETLDLMAYGDLPTCGEQDCTANPVLSEALTLPDFPPNLSDEKADHKTVIGAEGFNAYDRIKVKPGRTLNFSNQFDEYLIGELKAYPGSRLVLQPGTYWIDKLELNYARVEVAGSGTARLFVNKKVRISGSALNWARPRHGWRRGYHHYRGLDWNLEDAGDPAKLAIFSKDDVEIRKSVVSGLVYAEREASVRYDEAQVLGAIAARSVSLEKGARVTFDAAAVDAADLSGLCAGFIDSDGDGIEDDIDPDRDGDGVDNEFDAYPDDPERFELGSVEGLQAIPQGDAIYLEWREVTDFGAIAGYNIYRQPHGEPEVLIRQVAGDSPNLTDDTVENIRGYSYRITAVDGNGNEGGAGQQVAVFVAYNQTGVTNVSLSRLGSNASLTWDELPGFGFKIFRGESSLEMTETFEAGSSEFLDTGVLARQSYFYQIATVIDYTDVFSGETASLIGPVSEVFELPASGLPEQCSIVFPSALQNHDDRGKIKLKRWVQILGDPDNALETLELRQETGLPTCGNAFCQAIPQTTAGIQAPAFPRISKGDKFEIKGQGQRGTLGGDGNSVFRKVKVERGAIVDVDRRFDSYYIEDLNVREGTLRLIPGDYWIEYARLYEARVEVVGEGSVRLHIKKKFFAGKGSVVNYSASGEAGNAGRLIIHSYRDFNVDDSRISAMVFADRKAKLDLDQGEMTGAVSAREIELKGKHNPARFTFAGTDYGQADFGGLCIADRDGDGVEDKDDAFPDNPYEWSDLDGDGIGDNSDPDRDGDGISNDYENQVGTDPNDSDSTPPDLDGDGIPDSLDSDRDGDGIVNDADTFPDNPTEWADLDGDGIGDNSDPDRDGDGFENNNDAFPNDPAEWSDIDGDGIGDNADPDRDGDGFPNAVDVFPNDPSEWTDLDGDGIGDNSDPDRDGDGFDNGNDAFPDDPAEWSDIDGDGIGDNADPDRDGDGISNDYEEQLGFDPNNPNSTPPDLDGDGIPDELDDDRDGDGVDNDADSYPDDGSRSQIAAVSGLQSVQQGQSIGVSWAPHPDAIVVGYFIERSTYGGNDWQRLNPTPLAESNYADITVDNGSAYAYRVYAVDGRSLESAVSATASLFIAFNVRQVADSQIVWSNYQAALDWTLALQANERITIYRGEIADGDVAFDGNADSYIDPASHWSAGQQYQVVSVLSFDNPISGEEEERVGPAVEFLLAALPPLQASLEDAVSQGTNNWQREIRTGVSISIVGSIDNAIRDVEISLESAQASLRSRRSDAQFQFVLRNAQFGTVELVIGEVDAPADRKLTLRLDLIADTTPLTLQLDTPSSVSTQAGSLDVSGAVLNVDSGLTRLIARSDRFPNLEFGLTLIENNRFFGEIPLEFGDNQIQVSVVSNEGDQANASVSATRNSPAVPSIQFVSHTQNQVVKQPAITLNGRLYSSLAAREIQLEVNGSSVDLGPVQTGVLAFTRTDLALKRGFNQIVARAQTPLGSVQAALVIYFQDSESDPDRPLELRLTTPNDNALSNDDFLVVRGQLLNASSGAEVFLNGQPVALFGNEQSGWQFNSGLDISGLSEGDVVVSVDATDPGKDPVQLLRTVIVDRAAPVLSVDNSLLPPPGVNPIVEAPFVITGAVSDSNLASVTINGQRATLSPGSGPDSYLIRASLGLARAQQTTVDLLATDRAGNESRLSYLVLSNPGPAIQVIEPLENTEYRVFGGGELIEAIARVDNAPADSRLRVELGDVSVEQTVTQLIIASELGLAPDESIEAVVFKLLDSSDAVIARRSVPISVVDAANLPLALEKTVPQQGDRFREPHFPIQFFFNRPVSLVDLGIEVRETVHGESYLTNQTSGAGFGETYAGETAEVHLDQSPVPGSLSLLPGARIVEFYPTEDFHYGARAFVNLSYQGEPITRFYYEIRENPTFVKASVFDQAGQAVTGMTVSVPALQLIGQTRDNGSILLGASAPASLEVETGLYELLINPDQENPAYGTRSIEVQITRGKVNRLAGLRIPELLPEIPYRLLQSGIAANVFAGGDLEIDTSNATLEFPDGQSSGQVHVQVADYSEGLYSADQIEIAPMWMFNLQPGPIEADGEIGLRITMPALYGSHEYVPPSGTRVLLMALSPDADVVVPVGVGRIDGLDIVSEGSLRPERLDFIGFAFIAEDRQALAADYANGNIGLDALQQGFLE